MRCLVYNMYVMVFLAISLPLFSADIPNDSLILHTKLSLDGIAHFGNVQRLLSRQTIDIALKNRTVDSEIHLLYVYGEQANTVTENDVLSVVNFGNAITDDFAGLIFGTFESSRLRKIETRFQFGIGPKMTLYASETTQWKLSTVLLIDRTNFDNGERMKSNRLSLRLKGSQVVIEDKLRLSLEAYFQPSISHMTTDYRWRSTLRCELPFTRLLSISGAYVHSYESITKESRLPGDITLTLGLTLQLL